MGKIIYGAIGVIGVAGLAGLPALAQSFDRNRNISVMERSRPEYETDGLRMGGFTARPVATAGLTYNDNIYTTATNETSDVIARGSAELALSSNWSRHMLSFFGLLAQEEYLEYSNESHTDYSLRADGRADFGRASAIGGSLGYDDLTEPRGSTSSPASAAEPTDYSLGTVSGFVTHEQGRVLLAARSRFQSFDYDDVENLLGGVIDQDFRDRDVWTGTLRSDVAISPATALFLEGSYNDRKYDLQPPIVAALRDSHGYEILGGVNFELTNLLTGEVALGYLDQSYDDPLFSDASGLGGRVALEWFPTQLTTVAFGASRAVEDSVVPGSSSYLATQLSAGVDHELLRNLILSGDVTYSEDDYEGVNRTEERWSGTLGATYYLNRHIGLTGYYTYLDRSVSGVGGGNDYDVNRIGTSLRFQF